MNTQLTAAIVLILALTMVTLGYILMCWVYPFKHCPSCGGNGKRRAPIGRSFRLCRRCEGTGRRLRFGRWIYNELSRRRREANR